MLLAIPPGGEDACRRFYGTVLGMTELVKPQELAARGGLWVRSDRLEIHLGVEGRISDLRARRIRASSSPTWTRWPAGWPCMASR
ncbi:VOC family protein [Amycolatopsis panacis]|uniref:hypothetical protein n=1 Tax=Amycolatopsis panacis TaxID=2340917 RepID=UPI001F3DFE14|nr:hypothetical protein [Amycolatopsis panacis]